MKDVLLYTSDKQNALNEIDQIDGRTMQVFSNEVFLASVPDDLEESKLKHSTPEIPLQLTDRSRLAVDAWRRFERKTRNKAIETFDKREGISWTSPGFSAPKTFTRPVRLTMTGLDGNVPTSKYMIGSISVGIVIVSGPGALKFTQAEIETVYAEVMEGLKFLSDAEPRARIRFEHDLRTVDVNAVEGPAAPTDEEGAEALWRDPALLSMNYPASVAGVRMYVNDLRSSLHTQWAYAAFFTKYKIKHFAYTNNERVVMKYDNGDWEPDYINRVFAHETCHVFGAGDEYDCDCSDVYGYLNIPNRNCNLCPGLRYACLMEDTGYELCDWTRKQIGWDVSLFP